MDRNKFAEGKTEEEVKAKEVAESQIIKKVVGGNATVVENQSTPHNPLPNGRAVGDGHAAVTKTLIPDSFIDHLNAYIPPKK